MQTPDERDRLLNLPSNGYIFCFNLDEEQGRIAAEKLMRQSIEVAYAIHLRPPDISYVVVLMPDEHYPTIVFSDTAMLHTVVRDVCHLSNGFGQTFIVIIAPPDYQIATIIAEITRTDGTA